MQKTERFRSNGLKAAETGPGRLDIHREADGALVARLEVLDGIAVALAETPIALSATRRAPRKPELTMTPPPLLVMDDDFVLSCGEEWICLRYAPYDDNLWQSLLEAGAEIYARVNIVAILILIPIMLGALGLASIQVTNMGAEATRSTLESAVEELEEQP